MEKSSLLDPADMQCQVHTYQEKLLTVRLSEGSVNESYDLKASTSNGAKKENKQSLIVTIREH